MAASQPSAAVSGNSGNASSSEHDADKLASDTPAPDAVSSKPGTPKPKPGAPPAASERDKDVLNKVLVDRYVTRDWIHSAALKDAQDRMVKDTRETRQRASQYKEYGEPGQRNARLIFGPGYSGYGNGYTETGGPTKILYPSQKRPGRRTTPSLKYSRKDMKKQAEEHEELVPVRIDVDWDKVKLRDTFTFNLHDRLVPIETFAAQLVEDMGLKPPLSQPVFEQVVHQMHEQLQEYHPHVFSEEDALDPELPYLAYKNDEMRILIKLNITIGAHTLVDQFEWEINNPMNSPEEFAACMARDLALSGEFTTAIAHCIREQSQLFTRSLYSVGHPFDGRPIEDSDLTAAFLPSPIPFVFRPQQQAKDYAPYLYENTEAELERSETMFSREQRRQKRSVNRRGGPILPDLKERQRTIRTSIVSSVLPGAAVDIEESRLYKRALGAGGISGRGGKRTLRDGELSDSDESEDSAPDSPAMSQLQGTARTRGMRGAASAAQQRMANLGRSETPEATIHHHETRTSRRFGREATREETEEPQQLIVTIKVSPANLRKLFRDLKARGPVPPSSGSATPAGLGQARPSAGPTTMGPPPSTPSSISQTLPPKPATPAASLQVQPNVPPKPGTTPSAGPNQNAIAGRMPAPPPPPIGQPPHPLPAPPDWLIAALEELQKRQPDDRFEGVMRYCTINPKNGEPLPVVAGREYPADGEYFYLARIRCLDCTGKLYTPGPGETVENFEVHIRNRHHRDRVEERGQGQGQGQGQEQMKPA
ncbi:SNF5-like protein [Echria macrotheca]|uniref:SNF5-like protein n=1 Tax=Echria macrotheca TaxID=438768 RepID=A0AAJ0BFA9_9PEZI|nr:SNF5-like protein [Echria macrotheca]